MTTTRDLEQLIVKFRMAGGIVRTKVDGGEITAVSIGMVPGGTYKRLGTSGGSGQCVLIGTVGIHDTACGSM